MVVNFEGIDCVLLDIEGTTTSISFVKDVLFPYVKNGVHDFIEKHWQDPVIASDIQALQLQSQLDVSSGMEGVVQIPNLPDVPTSGEISSFIEAVVNNVLWQMSLDRKTTSLKRLQGHMWSEAYTKKEICGHIFDDVPDAMRKWKSASILIYIYSSGSVEAQKLLFGHSSYGNLLELIDGHFDTTIGQKVHPTSYRNILKTLGLEGQRVLFLTDVSKEAYAAEAAGLKVCLIIREGNVALTENEQQRFRCASSFTSILIS